MAIQSQSIIGVAARLAFPGIATGLCCGTEKGVRH
jgi:hypothetical protein